MGFFKGNSVVLSLTMMRAAQLCDYTTFKYDIHVNFNEAIFFFKKCDGNKKKVMQAYYYKSRGFTATQISSLKVLGSGV